MRFAALFALTLTPALALAPAPVLANEEEDRGFLAGLLEENLSSAGRDVRIEGFQGALSSRARISRLIISDDAGPWLTLTDVLLDWNRAALFTGKLSVNALTAAHIDVARLPQPAEGIDLPAPEASPFSLPDLPVSVQIGQITAEKITLGPTILGEEVTARLDGGANLADGEGNARIELVRSDATAGKLTFEGGFVNSSRELRLDLALQEPAGGIAARLIGLPGTPALDMSVKGAGPIEDFSARIALRSDGAERLAGDVRLRSEKTGALGFGLDLQGDVTPLFLPDFHSFFGPDVALKAEGAKTAEGAFSLETLELSARALQLNGAARIAASGLPEAFDLRINLSQPSGEPVRLPLSGDPVELRSGQLALRYDAATGEAWQLTGTLAELTTAALNAGLVSLEGEGRIGRDSGITPRVDGGLRFSGTSLAFSDPGLAELLGSQLRGSTGFSWQQGQSLEIRDLVLNGIGMALEGEADVALSSGEPELTGRFAAALEDLGRAATLAARPLGGRADLTLEGRFAPLSGAFDGRLNLQGTDLRLGLAEVDGLLQGSSSVALNAARGADGLEIRSLAVNGRSLAVTGSGHIRSTGPDLALDLNFGDLSVMGPAFGGALNARATLAGRALDNDLNFTLTGQGQNLRSGIAEADGFLTGTTDLKIRGHLLNGIVTLQEADLTGSSWAADVTGFAGVENRDLNARFRLDDLSRAGAGFRGALNGAVSYALKNGVENAGIDAEARNIALGQPQADSLLRGTTRLSAAGSREGDVLRLERLDLSNPQLEARAAARQDGGQRLLDLTARLGDLGLLVPGVPGPLTLSGAIRESAGQLGLNLQARGPGGIDLALSGNAPLNFSDAALRITGSANAALANAFLGSAAISGPLRLDLALNGAPSLNALSGRVSLAEGRLTVASPPVSLSGLSGDVTLSGGQASLNLSGRSDAGGSLQLRGPVALSAPYQGGLNLSLNDFVQRDPQLYETRLNGDITINGPLTGGAMIAGRIRLGQTELRIPSTGLGGTSAIPDIRHYRESAAVNRTRERAGLLDEPGTGASGSAGGGPVYALNIGILAENQIFIRGRGLDAELGGGFRIGGTTANIAPAGGLQLIRGRLDLLGKRFNFTEGSAQLEGTLMPRIRLVATTDTVDGTASVVVDGPADQPVITFVSSPELPQEEVVARLLFGRGLTTLSPLQAAQLASAVANLTGKGGAGLVDNLRRSFGLDDFDVSASEGGAAAVRAGKYLSDNVYVDLKLDSEGKSEVSINLDVSRSVTVRGRAGADGNTGIGIHFERDY